MPSRQCERAQEYVSLELDGELSGFSAALMRRHVARCPDCRAYAESVRAATALLRSAPLVEWSAELPVARSRRRRPHVPAGIASVAAAAAVLAVVAGLEKPYTPVTEGAAATSSTDMRTMRQVRRQSLRPPATAANVRIRVVEVD